MLRLIFIFPAVLASGCGLTFSDPEERGLLGGTVSQDTNATIAQYRFKGVCAEKTAEAALEIDKAYYAHASKRDDSTIKLSKEAQIVRETGDAIAKNTAIVAGSSETHGDRFVEKMAKVCEDKATYYEHKMQLARTSEAKHAIWASFINDTSRAALKAASIIGVATAIPATVWAAQPGSKKFAIGGDIDASR